MHRYIHPRPFQPICEANNAAQVLPGTPPYETGKKINARQDDDHDPRYTHGRDGEEERRARRLMGTPPYKMGKKNNYYPMGFSAFRTCRRVHPHTRWGKGTIRTAEHGKQRVEGYTPVRDGEEEQRMWLQPANGGNPLGTPPCETGKKNNPTQKRSRYIRPFWEHLRAVPKRASVEPPKHPTAQQ